MRRYSTVRRALVVGAMALAAALSLPATAGTGVGDRGSGGELAQALDESVVDRTAAAATALAGEPGYAGVDVNYDARTVTVSWKGDAPAAVGALKAHAPGGVTVQTEQTPLSNADLRAASTRLLDSQRALSGSEVVVAALPTEDGTGLVAEVSREAPAARTTGLAESLERAAGVPVRVELVDDDMRPTAVSRRDDGAPWHAGGAIAAKDGTDYCTTGFSLVTGSGHRRIVSAAHCDKGVGSVVRDGVGQRLGEVTDVERSLDAELIDPVGDPKTAGAVFGGPWNASPGHPRYKLPVAGVQRPVVGQTVCSSGAVTGEHCATVRATDVVWSCGDKTCIGFRASRDDREVVVGGGDSGGPMYTVRGGQAYAVGMIDGGSSSRSCGSTSLSTQCFSYVYGVPMMDILDHWDARIDH